ncbi:hypothetical protein [Ramlibacter sp. PS4R-6]|uniref:hypothetical protein n=1 Tax=Ramlibacter sp. PS4R-6 TaxID=3133438 RepID=UPI0030B4AD79
MNTPKIVTRVLRASVSRISGSVMEALFDARERAVNERVEGLHASLMYSSGWFLLWLEGSDEAVDTVLARSSKKLRKHVQPRIIHRSKGAATLKEALTVMTTQWPETPADFARRIEAVEHARPLLEPKEMWRRLAEPCALGEAHPARRVALVGADDTRSIDFVRKLADRFGAPMVYQRFANSDLTTRDVGAVYVDLPIDGEPTRVQVLSRRALGHRMVRESLRNVQKIAVVLGPRPGSAIELADSVAGFVHAVPAVPEIDLIGQCAETAHSVSEYLCRQVKRAITHRVSEATEANLLEVLFGPPLAKAA